MLQTAHLLAVLALLRAADSSPNAAPTSSPADAGCADGTREAFQSQNRYPDIAGCSGGFALPGVVLVKPPACHRRAGNDSRNPKGVGCNVADLCAQGWHVCAGAKEVATHSSDGCDGARDSVPSTFFTTRQSGPGYNLCAIGTARCAPNTERVECLQTPELRNDFFGCGDIGYPAHPSCAPLNRSSGNVCAFMPPPWKCRGAFDEAATVRKLGPEMGGVLCCRDAGKP